jgi:transposase
MTYNRFIKQRKKKMNEYENAPQTESTHPVLAKLYEQIADLTSKVEKATTLDTERVQTITRIRNEKYAYEEKVKTVLVEALEDHDEDTVRYIAEQLNIQLTKTKQIEVNVTFTIDVEHEIGEEPDPEWDFDFSVSHSDIVDYTSDVIYSKDV